MVLIITRKHDTGNIFANKYLVVNGSGRSQHDIRGTYYIMKESSERRVDMNEGVAIDMAIYEKYSKGLDNIWIGNESKGLSKKIKQARTRRFKENFQQVISNFCQ